MDMVGRTFKHYKIEELMGKGGMGVVYRALDTKLNRQVAFKVLTTDLTADAIRLRRFLQEARSAAAVSHPAIAQVYDIDEVDNTVFIAMEFIDGKTVSELIANRELDLIGSVEIALQVAEGLSKAHKTKIIHRDIKSDNIMVTRDGHPKLLDFGLAKLLDPNEGLEKTETLPEQAATRTMYQTVPGTVLGTIAYMSPEQARGQELSYSSDIFSLGIVLYEMVSGELPFKGDSPLDTMHSIAFDEVRPVTVIRKNLPPELHRIISRCLRKRPEDRYQEAAALALELKHLKRDIESGVQRPMSAGHRLQELKYWLQTSLPGGEKILIIVAALLIVVAVLFIANIQWSTLVGIGLLGFFLYRYIKNRKNRMLNRVVAKAARYRDVRAIRIRDNLLTLIVDRAPASLYIRINSLVDSLNKKLFTGKPVEVNLRDDLSPEEFQQMLREPGMVYVRDDVVLESPPSKSG